ncbi:hypothetical protein ACVIJ6_004189 [Bradyrhizobium sp. USDA 4369]
MPHRFHDARQIVHQAAHGFEIGLCLAAILWCHPVGLACSLPSLLSVTLVARRILLGDDAWRASLDHLAFIIRDLDKLLSPGGMGKLTRHADLVVPPKTVAERTAVLRVAEHRRDRTPVILLQQSVWQCFEVTQLGGVGGDGTAFGELGAHILDRLIVGGAGCVNTT